MVVLGSALLSTEVAATSIVGPPPLINLLRNADHVFIGKVVHVEMVDQDGAQILESDARTGPGRQNTLRLHVVRVEDGLLYSRGTEVPPTEIVVPLWPMWHMSLEQKRRSLGTTSIFIVNGPPWALVSPAGCILNPQRRAEVESTLTLLRELLEGVGASLEGPPPPRTTR
ncbi:MAG: hypothetical protein IPG45_26905 [Deltaproteobacteria bacterium]|nr:hypothetical protein [Deltaproteobacteria bacterium]